MTARDHYAAMIKSFVRPDKGLPDIEAGYNQPSADVMCAAHICAALDRMTDAIKAQTEAALPYYAVALERMEAQRKRDAKVDAEMRCLMGMPDPDLDERADLMQPFTPISPGEKP